MAIPIDLKGIPTVVNRFGSTTLAQAFDISETTSCVLTDASGLPDGAIGGCIQVNDEIIYFESRSGNTLSTLRRGQDNTSAVTHAVGSTVTSRIVAGNFNSLKDAVVELEDAIINIPTGGETETVLMAVRNASGATIPKASVVYVSGESGGKLLIELADADSEIQSSKTIGLTRTAINNNSDGFVVIIGAIDGVNTQGMTAGAELWLSQTPGAYTTTKPVSPAHLVQVGFVKLVGSSTTNGSLEVRIDNGYEIEELHDVLVTAIQNGQVLKWDSVASLWKNVTLQISDISNLQSVLNAKISADGSINTHSDVDTSTTAPTSGQALAWSGTQWVPTTISAGGAVDSVFGRTGTVVAQSGDYDADQIDDATTINKFATQAELDEIAANTLKRSYPLADETKLSGIEAGAEVNNISDVDATDLTDGLDSALHFHSADRDRANHTGTQLAATISDFDTAVSANTDVVANTAKRSYPIADETKLAGIEANAEVNNILDVDATDLTDGGDSTLHFHSSDRDRANHTGTQTASTISDFDTAVSSNSDVVANTAKVSADGSIDTHSDVDTSTTAPTSGQALAWSGTQWVPTTISAGGAVSWGTIIGTLSNQTDLQNALDAKVDENAAITGATKTKITYDSKGLVTAGVDATTDDITEGSINKYYPSADETKLAGIEAGAEVNNISDVDATDLTDGLDSTLHFHSADRDRANHTGTQLAATISDFDAAVSANTDVVTNTAKRSYPIADETKLAGIEAGAEVNNISDVNATDLTDGLDSTLHFHSSDRSRANHTGTQTASTISDFDTEVSNNASVTANTAKVSADGSINTHSDVDTSTTAPTSGQALVWDGTKWEPGDVASSVAWGDIGGTLSNQTDLQSALDGKVDENAAITGATKTKITYDAKGLVTAGADAAIADITGLQNALDAKVDENAAITGATKTKITYDAKGLVTAGADATTDDISEGATNKYYPSADASKLAGIEAGAEVNNISDVNATDLTDGGDSSLHFHSSDRNRANHTGTQLASTISNFDTEVSNNSSVTANTAKVSASGSIDTHSDVDTSTVAPTSGQALAWNGTDWVPTTISGGGGSPAGGDTQIQYNDSGAFGASANFTYNGQTLYLKSTGTNSSTNCLNILNGLSLNLFTVRGDGTFTGRYFAIGELQDATRVGEGAGKNAAGIRWTAIGADAGSSSTSGNNWTAIGPFAGTNSTSGDDWMSIGRNSGRNNTTGNAWTSIGTSSAFNNVNGSNWVAIGNDAARYINGGVSSLQYFQNSVYIGSSTKGTNGTSGTPTTNETVIGYQAEGNGSNTVTIGGSAVTDNYLTGKVHVTSSVQVGNDSDTATAANVGAMRYRADANNSYMDMCMQTGASTYAWVNIKTNTW